MNRYKIKIKRYLVEKPRFYRGFFIHKNNSEISVDKDTFELGKKAFLNIQNYGYTTWHDWSIENWGTKWNAYGCHDKIDSSNMDTICLDIRKMKDSECLILQGCGEDLKEWLDGIDKTLKEENILMNDTKFKEDNCYVFENENFICILFKFINNVNLDIGKLAM